MELLTVRVGSTDDGFTKISILKKVNTIKSLCIKIIVIKVVELDKNPEIPNQLSVIKIKFTHMGIDNELLLGNVTPDSNINK